MEKTIGLTDLEKLIEGDKDLLMISSDDDGTAFIQKIVLEENDDWEESDNGWTKHVDFSITDRIIVPTTFLHPTPLMRNIEEHAVLYYFFHQHSKIRDAQKKFDGDSDDEDYPDIAEAYYDTIVHFGNEKVKKYTDMCWNGELGKLANKAWNSKYYPGSKSHKPVDILLSSGVKDSKLLMTI